MSRQLWFGLCILLLVTAPLTAPAAQGLGTQTCRVTRAIVSAAITGRRAGETAAAIVRRLSGGDTAVAARYRPTVPTLVDLVFTLDPVELTEATAELYEAQCLGFEG